MPRLIKRLLLALEMTWDYSGRFPRRKIWSLYWRQAGRMVNDD